ncbi:MAG: sodium:solute symporter family protein [Rhodothermales bacterium]
MQLAGIDWAIMAAFFAISLAIGFAVSRAAGKDFNAFFLGSRSMPWWLLGISMVATTFSTDTPNLVTDLIRTGGNIGNWGWWCFLLTGMLTVFLYAKLWRRSGVLTDVEFYEIRYSGKLAAFLRGFRAVYLGIVFNIIVMASVTLAAIKYGSVLMGWSPLETILIAASVTLVYSVLGGLRGVLLTDLVQFGIAMTGSIWAAWYILNLPEVGGLSGLLNHENVVPSLAFLPDFEQLTWTDLLPIFLIPLAIQWWATYYPGAEPGGGGYIVQRMLSAKDEKHAVKATLAFNAMHYALRPWPWILIGLASMIVFPELADLSQRFPDVSENVVGHDLGYPAMLTFLPAGLLGLLITSVAAAFMSTMSTHVNWGSSLLVNDVYHRFFNPDASEKQLVWAGKISTILMMIAACFLALFLTSAQQVFNIMLQLGAGTGLLYLLRWFWWRINAAAELTALISALVIAFYFQLVNQHGLSSWEQLTVGTAITTAAWLIVAFTTKPTDDDVLLHFYRKIKPGGPGWRRVVTKAEAQGIEVDPEAGADLPYGLAAAVLGAAGIYSILFATGFIIYGRLGLGIFFSVVGVLSFIGIAKMWPRLSFE